MFICFLSPRHICTKTYYSMGIECIQFRKRECAFIIGNNYRNWNAMESEANMYLKQTIAMINSGMSPGRKKQQENGNDTVSK